MRSKSSTMNHLISSFSDLSSGNLFQTALTITILPLLISYANQLVQRLPTFISTIAKKLIDLSSPECVEITCREHTLHLEIRNDMFGLIQQYVDKIASKHKNDIIWETNGLIIEALFPTYNLSFALNNNQSISFLSNSKDWSIVSKSAVNESNKSIWMKALDFIYRFSLRAIRELESLISIGWMQKNKIVLEQRLKKTDTVYKIEIRRNLDSNDNQTASLRSKSSFNIRIYNTNDDAIIYDFVNHIIHLYTKGKNKSCRITTIDKSPELNEIYTYNLYSLDSLLLDEQLKQKLRRDFTDFWSNEDHFSNICQPFRRGYLLMGPPGCGKSSIIKCLQRECPITVDLMIVKLSSSIQENEMILQRLRKSTRNSAIWVFEDIDCVGDFLNKREEDKEDNSTDKKIVNQKREGLSDFLNTIDGIGTPEGIMIIFTSNHPKNLDDALTRPGRMDRIWNIGPITDRNLIQQYFERFIEGVQLPDEFFDLVKRLNVTPSFIVKIFGIYRNLYLENENDVNSIDFMKIANDFLIERNLLISK